MKYAKIIKFLNDNKSLLTKNEYGTIDFYVVWSKSGNTMLADICLPKKFWLHNVNEKVHFTTFPTFSCVDSFDRKNFVGGTKDFTDKEMEHSWTRFVRRFNKMVDNHGLKLGDK